MNLLICFSTGYLRDEDGECVLPKNCTAVVNLPNFNKW